ncbi:MAG TPA: biotin/lipoyl-binding protein, partial [Nocardioides sp.]
MRKRLTERWRRLGRTARILLAAGVAAAVVGGGAGAWALTREDTTQSQTMTVQASSGTVKQTVSASGTVEAAETADLTFEVSGTVTKVHVAEGDVVKKGQPLAEVDDESLIASRTAAESALTAAQEQYETDQDSGASDVQLASDEAAVVS